MLLYVGEGTETYVPEARLCMIELTTVPVILGSTPLPDG